MCTHEQFCCGSRCGQFAFSTARVLRSFFASNRFDFKVTSGVLPGVQGSAFGSKVADFVVDNLLTAPGGRQRPAQQQG